ncbi:DUF4397 domain-containing protein [Bacillus sp. FJAT-29790]|uniref:DUF4397 domain-containing protein n=1 Tax=Bacillus sp. FJAT-29790 TaxID=1895002 RepID=UPI001C2357E9|nr:DUF4397 domain-containing protein [Bacillus sp. FJAT-29790]MBU8878938.1 DUF4397 domain-containing protein [Bacillus sp. FJAT-29790]
MSQNRNQHEYFQKAAMYDLLANYYKYTDPNKHIAYYQQHLQNINLALQTMRTNMTQSATHPAKIRFVQASFDTPNVDIYVNGTKVLKDFPYKEVSNYLSLHAGKYQIDIYPAGNMVSTILSRKVVVEPGKHYTLITAGSADKLKWVVLEDNLRIPRGETKVRFIHLSPDASAVDIAVKNGDVIFPQVSFRHATGYLGLSPMIVNLEARAAGTTDAVLTMPPIQFKPNEGYSILMIGSVKGEPALEAFVING